MSNATQVETGTRAFLPPSLTIECWEDLEPFFRDLATRPLHSKADLEAWISDKSDLDAAIAEAFSWMYIHISRNNQDQQALERYQYAVQHIQPPVASRENLLNQRLVQSPFFDQLDTERYWIYQRKVKNAVDLFCEQNVPITTEVQLKSKEYGRIFSQMTIGMEGRQLTLQKASTLLEEHDRERRQAVYHKINQRILQDTEEIESLFDALLSKRHHIARNSGFDNYRDYAFRTLNRFDYTPEDCLNFHQSIAEEIVPLLNELYVSRRDSLGLDELRPWDLHIDAHGKEPLRPYESMEDFLAKGTHCLSKLDPAFGKVIQKMDDIGHIDLESRKGKRPGAYNMPLFKSGIPFLFMNASYSLNDLRTLMHESGHAIHSYLTQHLRLSSSRTFPSEISELAAMTMELLTLEHWDVFFDREEDLRRAKINQLELVLKVLPWIAVVDKFQHWLYLNPDHSREERKAYWSGLVRSYTSSVVDYSGMEHYVDHLWHKQLHVFEVPFYYIEYGFAQLGAIAIWRQYRQDPEGAVHKYKEALKLGYTKPIADVYRAAGIEFDFSQNYVQQLGAFVREELHSLMD
jgi:oligoendopeptidase F